MNKWLSYVAVFGVLEFVWGLGTNQPGNTIFGLLVGGAALSFIIKRSVSKKDDK